MRANEFIFESVEQRLPSLETVFEAEWDQTPVKHYSPKAAYDIHRDEDLTTIDDKLYNQSIGKYTSGQGAKWNDFLHRHYRGKFNQTDLKRYQKHITDIDSTLAKNTLKQDYVLYTGLKESPADAFKLYNHPRTTPIPVHLPAYTSTTTSWDVAKKFTAEIYGNEYKADVEKTRRAGHELLSPTGKKLRNAPTRNAFFLDILRIFVPAGSTGGSVRNLSRYDHEYEILLPRGLDVIISPKPQVIDEGRLVIYLWNAKVIGHNPQPIQVVDKK